ncbi:GNAT family N-acetyltransferase [Kitasatospora sp. RB6PN24]|uniref:GNAT family N-acetyltransferase n=1 Tax=Kitasatospora humi TaxID=2893891 RepID=UPI001E2E098B|nr:GNAT family N-acetyltransferase [Kitasatospora humi]MCC9310232.1 GNAT family N-acetyltransferase [Kitasatospora humi]
MSTSQFPDGGTAEIRIDRSDVGRRVSVRRLETPADPATGRPVFRDVIGVLTSWNDHELTVVGRDCSEARIPVDRLVAGKVVPPRFDRRGAARRGEQPQAGPAELQRLAAGSWPAVEREQLGDWTLRAAQGFTKRANSAQLLGDPGLPRPAALERVRAWYTARALPAWVEVTVPGTDPALVAELDGLGERVTPTLVRTAPLAPLARPVPGAELVRLSRTAGDDWLAVYHRFEDDGTSAEAAHRVLHGGPSVWFATVPDPDGAEPLAIGRCVIDGAWAHFGAVEVQPRARRRGLARAVMAVLAARAAEERARGAHLQVEADNEAANALYDDLGFRTSHTYHYVRLPQA